MTGFLVPSWLDSSGGLLHRDVQRFRGGLVIKAHRLCVSLNSRLETKKKVGGCLRLPGGLGLVDAQIRPAPPERTGG